MSPLTPISNFVRYLANLQWKEVKQPHCTFCDVSKLKGIVETNETMRVFENRTKSGKEHLLLCPVAHIRDIEQLTPKHLPLILDMKAFVEKHIQENFPDVPKSRIHCGFHRGRRPFLFFMLPDIVSIHHLHLHLIILPGWLVWLLKYPAWNPFMWLSLDKVIKKLQAQQKRDD